MVLNASTGNSNSFYTDSTIYDSVVIGAGPAGAAAATYLIQLGNHTLVVYKSLGGQAAAAVWIENYTGLPPITGADFAKNLLDQIKYSIEESMKRPGKQLRSKIVEGVVTKVDLDQKIKIIQVKTLDGETILVKAKTVIIATGSQPKKLFDNPDTTETECSDEEALTVIKSCGAEPFVPTTEDLEWKEREEVYVSYCSVCEGFFYKGKDAAVVGGGNSAMESALNLANNCKKVYVIVRKKTRASYYLVNRAENTKNVTFVMLTKVFAVRKGYLHLITGKLHWKLKTDGVFISIGSKPTNDFLEGQVLIKDNYIVVDNLARTSKPGVFACGDGTYREHGARQIVTAAAQGCDAALSAHKFLQDLEAA